MTTSPEASFTIPLTVARWASTDTYATKKSKNKINLCIRIDLHDFNCDKLIMQI
jgi:hypothetical protein